MRVFDRGGAALVGAEARELAAGDRDVNVSNLCVIAVHPVHSSVVRCATSGSSAGGIW